ncbi:MAG: hypothetical protein JWL62_351 [Hyphomicrobiales bacterium]|nr:hypothetical protein [Hyphomicrobiales bacterium]
MMRVIARWIDDPTESPLVVDLLVDTTTLAVAGPSAAFGCIDLEGPNQRAFVLDSAGRVDLGPDATDRYWNTDLRSTRIAHGEFFNMFWRDGDSGAYKIVKVSTLGSKAP